PTWPVCSPSGPSASPTNGRWRKILPRSTCSARSTNWGAMPDRYLISVTVNGQAYQRAVEPRLLLSDFLRHELGLTGTHVGCEHGVCGACTVLVDEQLARSCLMFAVQADGHEVETVEGLGDGSSDALHPLQAAFREA